jgi:hypothetical protein
VRRRDFITLVGGAGAAWPLAAHAQQGERMRRIGVLMGYIGDESGSSGQALIAAFREGLQKLGWTEGRNTRIDIRWASPADAESIQRFVRPVNSLQLTKDPDCVRSFGGYYTFGLGAFGLVISLWHPKPKDVSCFPSRRSGLCS